MIQWEIDAKQQEEISSFRVFLNNKLHGEVPTGGRQTFKYEFTKLESDENYSIYVKSFVGAQKLDGYSYQCSIESKASNEIVKKCAAPLKGTMLRMEKMHPKGIELAWDEPEPNDEVNLTVCQSFSVSEIPKSNDKDCLGLSNLKGWSSCRKTTSTRTSTRIR